MSHNPSSSSGSRSLLTTMENTLKSPRPATLFLNKPLNGNGSSVSVNEIPVPSTPGIRAHLGHLLPRHTYFRAKILIHQISSVPFVSGEFGVRWKFKNVHTLAVHKQGILDRVMGNGEKKSQSDKGKAREDSGEMGWLREMLSPTTVEPPEDGYVGSSGRRQKGAAAPQGIISSVSSRSSKTKHSQNLSADSSGINTLSALSTATDSTAGATTILNDTSGTLSNIPSLPISTTPVRGMTPFLKLKEHSITWSQQLDPILKLDIDRETLQVQPCPLKLVVMQRVIPDDPEGPPQNPRLGAVYLNLAEYIGHGPIERRYLLKESKTNATLRLTIEMEYVSGETNYIPPPLAKGEIQTGIAGFLEQDAVKKRPRVLDIYGPYKDQEELEIDLLGATKTAIPKTAKSTRTIRQPSNKSNSSGGAESPMDSGDESDSNDADDDQVEVVFDVQRLPFAYGTKTTEALIDALFNPTRTTEKHHENPFTYYEPPSPSEIPPSRAMNKGKSRSEPAVFGLGLSGVALDRNATIGRRQGSMSTTEGAESVYSSATTTTTSSCSASIHTMTSESSRSRAAAHNTQRSNSVGEHGAIGAGDRSAPDGRVVVNVTPQKQAAVRQESTGVKGWWRRRTRPSTPTTRQAS
ncbi:hypothetical protein BDN70DRAFT_880906 [Pholiota conissans]|uniref:C2 NT-type domain-containing protein n=1 Tax=Pholiota conissans TaxID=109636 RepID=A0A9P5Z009_9AGAR|nr:hypothetical protein BDN70DRAFT_880906 [Pholiota conissans]